MKKKPDLRTIRTKKMIIEAFIELVEEKGYDKLTIQDIADRAMINRATFYAHFKDKQDLYEHIFDVALNAMIQILDTVPLMEDNRVQVKGIERILTAIFQQIQENKPFFISMTQGSSMDLMRTKLSSLLEEKYVDIFSKLRIKENDIDVPIDFIIEYMTSIFMTMVHWSIHSQTDFPPEHMARLTIKLVGNGHLTVLGVEVDKS